eukprot:TRINITY_DN67693_c0_g1_i1.p2 TRINITY_DN67693_c0_g1~~TRINITY_DN67693_c0_g1_i1.p2  ORF type:complete len:125 (-),score=14.40 TRINITY_DN67693_c0_g1_i1:71-445(-)
MPMIVRMQMLPCEHMLCYSCSQPESKVCYMCEKPLIKMIRIDDNSNVFMCEYPGCYKAFLSLSKLQDHNATEHMPSGVFVAPSGSYMSCLLYTSDAADDTPCVDLGGRRIIKKKKHQSRINHGI